MMNRGETDSFARRNAEPLVSGVAVGPSGQVGACDNFFITD